MSIHNDVSSFSKHKHCFGSHRYDSSGVYVIATHVGGRCSNSVRSDQVLEMDKYSSVAKTSMYENERS